MFVLLILFYHYLLISVSILQFNVILTYRPMRRLLRVAKDYRNKLITHLLCCIADTVNY